MLDPSEATRKPLEAILVSLDGSSGVARAAHGYAFRYTSERSVLSEMIRVLVLKRHPEAEEYVGFWAVFDGERVSSYQDTRDGNKIFYTLYKCNAYVGDAYRVHIGNKSDPRAPEYELRPVRWDPRVGGGRPNFSEVWNKENIAQEYPIFLQDMEYLETLNADRSPSF
jgi:hypothetical protein